MRTNLKRHPVILSRLDHGKQIIDNPLVTVHDALHGIDIPKRDLLLITLGNGVLLID